MKYWFTQDLYKIVVLDKTFKLRGVTISYVFFIRNLAEFFYCSYIVAD